MYFRLRALGLGPRARIDGQGGEFDTKLFIPPPTFSQLSSLKIPSPKPHIINPKPYLNPE